MPGPDEWIRKNQKLYMSLVAVLILALGAVVGDYIMSIMAVLLVFSITYFIEWSREVTELVKERRVTAPAGTEEEKD